METWGSCCISRCSVDEELDRLMQRYRPIAPKPGDGAAASLAAQQAGSRRPRRTKRKRGENPSRRKIRKTKAVAFKGEESIDLPTFSISPPPPPSSSCSICFCSSYMASIALKEEEKAPAALSPGNSDPEVAFRRTLVAPRPVRPAGSWVTLERVTGTWRVEGEASDEDVQKALAVETNPAFVSDAQDHVTWTNEAYRRMVAGPEEEVEIRVALVTRGMVPAGGTFRGFTCGVRVRHAWNGKPSASMAAPCDVWRLRDGSLAWRLDVKAALSLGPGT